MAAVKDSISFMGIVTYIIYIFGVVYLFLIYMKGELIMVNLVEQMGVVFAETLGGFENPKVGPEKEPGVWFIFTMLQIIINIIVLNTLIAILGNSYDIVMNEQNAYDMRLKIELLLELNDILMRKANEALPEKYIIIVRYFEKNQTNTQWEGKIKMITRQIKSQGDDIIAKVKSVDETTKAKIEDNKKQIEAKIETTKAKIEEIKKDMAEKIEQENKAMTEEVKKDMKEMNDKMKDEMNDKMDEIKRMILKMSGEN